MERSGDLFTILGIIVSKANCGDATAPRLCSLSGAPMKEPTDEERFRLSGPAMRVFDNVTQRWGLSERMKLQLLGCAEHNFHNWARDARRHRPLILEVAVMMRISAVLGIFGDLQQLTNGAAQERQWLTREIAAPPFEGKAPIALLCRSFESQMDIRRHLSARVVGQHPPNAVDEGFRKYTDKDLIWV